jgi:hypothetical protein
VTTYLFRAISLTLILTTTASSISRADTREVTPMDPSTLHQKLVARGIGKGVNVTEVDGTKANGTLIAIDADSFQIKPGDSDQPTRILNSQVAKFGNSGLSTGAKVAIGVGIGAIIFVVVAVIAVGHALKNLGGL